VAITAPSVPWPRRAPLLPSPPARNPVRALPDPPLCRRRARRIDCRPACACDRRILRPSEGIGAETRRAHPGPAPRHARLGPPSEDDGRRMPKDAAPPHRPRPGPANSMRRRPCRGAETRHP